MEGHRLFWYSYGLQEPALGSFEPPVESLLYGDKDEVMVEYGEYSDDIIEYFISGEYDFMVATGDGSVEVMGIIWRLSL